jgi:hypothetical protein
MKALLRADWLRLRRRRDLWLIFLAVWLIGGIGFISGYHTDAQAADKVARDVEQLASLQKYELPQSILTVVGTGIAPIVAFLLIASLVIGDEFRFGTLRTSLLAAGNRRKFLGARLISLLAMAIGMFAGLAVVAAILSLGLVIFGAELPPSTVTIDGGAAIGLVGADVLAVAVVIALATLLTVILRSGALPLLLVILGALLDLFVASLPVFIPGEPLAGAQQFLPVEAIRALLARLGYDTGATALADVGQLPAASIELTILQVAAIVAAWGLLFLFLADRRIRTMDVTE